VAEVLDESEQVEDDDEHNTVELSGRLFVDPFKFTPKIKS
jgi:hypothetical protein